MTCTAPEPEPTFCHGQAWKDPAGDLWFVTYSDSQDRFVLLANKYGEPYRLEITDKLAATMVTEWTLFHDTRR